jgi:hypothetical protein
MVNITSFSDMKAAEGDEDEGDHMGGDNPGNFAENAYSRRSVPNLRGNESVPFVYHELQESALCGQHCLNNLLQQRVFTEFKLADIAHQLDAEERMILAGADSNNVDATGNFSIQVLSRALQQSNNIELIPWAADNSNLDPCQFHGIVVNRREHWFTVREINGTWYNLNSTAERPEKIPDAHILPLMHQMRGDGYQIFLPTGSQLPVAGRLPTGFRGDAIDGKYWLKESELSQPLPDRSSGKGGQTKETPAPFSGKAQRLDGKQDELPPQAAYNGFGMNMEDEDPELAAAIAASLGQSSGGSTVDGVGDDFDADLARALELSKQDNGASTKDSGPIKTEKELAREKRLAALAARGL